MSGVLVVVSPGGSETKIPYTERSAPYAGLSKAVAGYIEGMKVRYEGRIRQAYVNEEGLILGLPYNDAATRLHLASFPKSIRLMYANRVLVGCMVIVVPTPRSKK